MTWATAFVLTLLLEGPVVYWGLGPRRMGWFLLANGLSHPALWFLLPWAHLDYVVALVVGEILVFALEGLLYSAALRSARGLAVSAAANALSCGVGLILQRVL